MPLITLTVVNKDEYINRLMFQVRKPGIMA